MPDLNVCTACLAMPFKAGWYGAVWVWHIPFDFRHSSNLAMVKSISLSVTIVSGIPKVAKVGHIFSIVTEEVAEVVMCTSIHFECMSISMRYILSRKRPA